jgi:hypothetical protein
MEQLAHPVNIKHHDLNRSGILDHQHHPKQEQWALAQAAEEAEEVVQKSN